MPIVVDYTDKVTLDETPVLEGTCSERNADVEAIIRVNPVTGGPDDTYNTKAIGGQWAVATEPLVRATGVAFASSKLPDANRYLMEPQLWRLNDDRMICVFSRNTAHIGNAGRIFCSRSDDEGITWGSEVLVHDHVSNYDTRNQAGGVDPVTGRVWVFMSIYDAVGLNRIDVGRVYSDDGGDTWSSYVSLLSEFPPPEQISGEVVPFGPMVVTSNGLMQLFYFHGDCWALFYDRGTETWGNRVDVWTGFTPSNSIGEPYACKIDDNRFVVTIRDNTNPNSHRYVTTADGGSTWSAISDPYKTTSAAVTANAPLKVASWRGQAIVAITTRAPDFKIDTCRLALEDYWDRPEMLWSEDNPYRINDTYSAVTSTSIDFGYAAFLGMPAYPDTGLIMFYDQDGATAADVSIYSMILGVV